jgi:hypothetical protein
MRAVLVLLAVAGCGGCAGTPARLVDVQGRPLPSSARLDTDEDPVPIDCDGVRYLVIPPPDRFAQGIHVGTPIPKVTAAVMCPRIRAER